MLTINASDTVSIVQVESIDGYDGHSLRSFSYTKNKMPDIVKQLSKLDLPGKFYKVTHDDGTVEFCHESDLPKS